MAHGGSSQWNDAISDAVAPLAGRVPVAVAFGMAKRQTLAAALDSLRERGVERVAVVRLFLSGRSFLDQTRFYLGLSDTPPDPFLLMGPDASDPVARSPIEHGLAIATHEDGVLTSRQATAVLAYRAKAMSADPSSESVLILAHGMGDEMENQQVADAMAPAAEILRGEGFAKVRVATLREDWAAERVEAEARIVGFVESQAVAGRDVLVVPARLFGFGPYHEVLAGHEYRAGEGLLPHRSIADWIGKSAARVACAAGWGPALGDCGDPSLDPL